MAVVSVYLGQKLQRLLEGGGGEGDRHLDAGICAVPAFGYDGEDRNRTAAMAFTGDKFEFRMVGSMDSVAMANTVICAAVAEAFAEAADALQDAQDPEIAAREYAQMLWRQHKRVVYNGDCYSEAWAQEAGERGLPCLGDMVAAVGALGTEETRNLFAGQKILSRRELESRAEVLYESYAKHMGIEARTMLEMAGKDYIPAAIRFMNTLDREQGTQRRLYEELSALLDRAALRKEELAARIADADREKLPAAVATAFRDGVKPAMQALRAAVDAMEMLVARRFWPVPTYGELLFDL